MKRKLLALVLAGLLCLGLTAPATAVEELTSLRVDEVIAYSPEESVYTVQEDGMYGYYRADGTLLLESNYAAAGEFHDGLAPVSLSGEWTLVQEDGEPVRRFRGGRFGYVDPSGALMIPMQYARAFPFSGDRAFAVKSSGELVLLDKSGRELAVYPDAVLSEDDVIQFSEGLAVIPVKGGEEQPEIVYLVVNVRGGEVCTLTDALVDYRSGYHDGCLAVAAEGQWTLDEDGKPVEFVPASNGWGYRDRWGEWAVEPRFEAAGAFSGGMAPVRVKGENGKSSCGLIAPDGGEVFPARYEDAIAYPDGAGAVLLEGKWAYVDREGRQITGFDYEEVSPFREGIAFVRVGGELRTINANGRMLFLSGAVRALEFSGGVAALERPDGTWGICNRDGEMLVDFTYERAYHWDGYLWLKRGDIWRVYDTREVIAAWREAPEGENAGVGTFTDVPAGAWYAEAVTWATDHNVITGTGGGQFSPDKSCTTGEILTFFWRAAGRPEPDPEAENPFTDVSPSNYYYQAALWAFEHGMVGGGTFGAAELCTRAMAVTYLWHLAGCPADRTAAFDDVSEDAEYAHAVAWAVTEGITAGNGGGQFSPDAICSRSQIVTFLYRFLAEVD